MKSKEIKSYALVLCGAFLIAAAFVLFITPYKIVPGGVYGAGVVFNYLFPSIQVGTWGLMMDIPLLTISLFLFGKFFGAKTIFAAVSCPVMMDAMTSFIGSDPATMLGGSINLTHDVLLSCIFGGVIMGAGISLILRSRATSGGTDIVAMIVSRYAHMPISRALLIVDSMVVIFGLVVLGDWKVPLYSLVTIYVSTKVIDLVLEGGSGDKLIFILSDKHDDIRHFILDDLSRGGTYIHSAGMYTNAPREMIFVVVSRREMTLLQDCVRKADPTAFMIVVNAHETLGDGFKTFQERIGG
ncbi:MAG: YitT family protein [Mucinivorans sp.]